MVKTEEEGSTNLGKVDPSLALLDLMRQYTNQGAKRPADSTPTTSAPPAKQANTDTELSMTIRVSGFLGAVRGQLSEEFEKQLPDICKELSKQLLDLLRDHLPGILSDQAPKNEGLQKLEEEIRQLREENRRLREDREKDKAALKELDGRFEEFRKPANRALRSLIWRTPKTEKRLDALESAKTTKAAASEEG